MNNQWIWMLAYTALAVLLISLLAQITEKSAKATQKRLGFSEHRHFALRRLIRLLYGIVLILLLALIWGANLQFVWISVTGVLAMIAIAFFAVWSLAGNILAGVILYFTVPFHVHDEVEIMPDNIRGRVQAINTFFTVLIDEEGHRISVPNAILFQRYIRCMTAK